MNKKIIGLLIVVLFMVVIIIPGNIIGECIDDQLDQQQTQFDGWIGLSKYDIIIFSGYSNPIDPEDMFNNMVIDIYAGRKLIFMSDRPFIQTESDYTEIKNVS